jgi:hypothetical protein
MATPSHFVGDFRQNSNRNTQRKPSKFWRKSPNLASLGLARGSQSATGYPPPSRYCFYYVLFFALLMILRQAKNPHAARLWRVRGSADQGAGDPSPAARRAEGGLWAFCLLSDTRPLVGRVDDSACVHARGWGCGGRGIYIEQAKDLSDEPALKIFGQNLWVAQSTT